MTSAGGEGCTPAFSFPKPSSQPALGPEQMAAGFRGLPFSAVTPARPGVQKSFIELHKVGLLGSASLSGRGRREEGKTRSWRRKNVNLVGTGPI